MRTFVAVFPPPEVQEALHRAARSAPVGGGVRWTRPSNIHLTLKFLGEVDKDSLDGIHTALLGIAGRHEPFRVQPAGLGTFPSARKARIIWAGVAEGSTSLAALAKDIEDSLELLGFGRETRPYKPHATLGRARGGPARLAETATGPLPGFEARRLDLVESVPGPSGVVYTVRESYPLSESPLK